MAEKRRPKSRRSEHHGPEATPPMARASRHLPDARPFLPADADAGLAELRKAAEGCRGCDLYKNATQVVFGEGRRGARIMLIGEQPGDQEDISGQPFVGPAGKLLDRALADARIDRSDLYLTNAVKHFKWKRAPRGKRRLHAKPTLREIRACYPWLEREISIVAPNVIVCLGVSAGQALFGSAFKLGPVRGKPMRHVGFAPWVVATAHPSAILRAPDSDTRELDYQALVADLKLARRQADRRPNA